VKAGEKCGRNVHGEWQRLCAGSASIGSCGSSGQFSKSARSLIEEDCMWVALDSTLVHMQSNG
jgi:hypothetical protein